MCLLLTLNKLMPPREAINVITIWHLNAQSHQQKHEELVWNMSRGKLFREKCLGGILWGEFSEGVIV